MRQRLQQEWLQQYGGTVAQQQLALTAGELASSMLPPVLQAYLPTTAQRQQHAALLGGAPLPAPLMADTRALRGCFALLLRSLAAGDLQANLLGLAAQGSQQRQMLLSQLKRLALLCCSVIGSVIGSGSSGSGSSSTDPLLQAASGRLLGILCDASLWKCFSTQHGQQPAVPEAPQLWLHRQLHSWLAPLPVLAAAASRLVVCLTLAQTNNDPGSASSSQRPPQQQQLAAVLNGLVTAQLRLWRQLQAGEGGSAGNAATGAAAQQLLQALATPGLLLLLAPATVAQLTAAPGFAELLESAATWQPAGSSSGDRSKWQGARGSEALCLLGTLSQLAAGKKASQQQGRQVAFLPPSMLLQQQGVAPALGAAAVALLQPALEPGSSSSASGSVAEQLWPFSEGTFAAQLLALLPLPQFARLYHLLLLMADSSGGGGSKAQAARLLSALAFGMQLLPRLWRQLATTVGLPLEAPLQATRGWEVPTLRHGIAGLQPKAATQLGLFCR